MQTFGERITRVGLTLLTSAVLIFLIAPILTIVPLSFSSGSFFYYPLPGFSLRWYEDFFSSSFWLPSLKNSLIVGVSATILATVLGTLAALGIWRARFPAQALVLALLISPMVVPVIIVAVSLLRVRAVGSHRRLSRPDPRAHDSGSAVCRHHGFGDAVDLRSYVDTRGRKSRRFANHDVPARHAAADSARRGVGCGIRVRRVIRRSRCRAADGGTWPAHAPAADVRRHQRQHKPDHR